MRPLAVLLFVSLSVAHAAPGRVHVTEFGRRVLANTDQIVEAKVARVNDSFRGITTARLEVKERLHGYDRAEAITLLYIEDYVAPDAFSATLDRSTVRYERERKRGVAGEREAGATRTRATDAARETVPSTDQRGRGAGVRLAVGDGGLFFLRRKGATYSLVGFLPERDLLYEVKRQRLVDVLDLEGGFGALDLRAGRAKRFFMKGLESRNVWERGNSARELMSLAQRYRNLFVEREVDRLVQALFAEDEPPIQSSLERAVRAIDPELALAYAREAESRARQRHAKSLEAERALLEKTRLADLRAADLGRIARRYRRAATGLLADFLEDPAPIVRERAAQSLAELAAPSARAPLRQALGAEKDPNAAMAMIYACGAGADPEAVDVVAARLDDAALERAAIHALARIGTPAARTALVRHRRRADTETQRLIDDLLREEFEERS
jgi:hypothetical protein